MTTPNAELLDFSEFQYTINFEVTATTSFMYIPAAQRQPGKPQNSLDHHLEPGSYLIQPVFFGAGRGFRITTSKGLLYRSAQVVGWSAEKVLALTVPPGKTEWLRVQEGSTNSFRQVDIDSGVNVALNITRIMSYIPK